MRLSAKLPQDDQGAKLMRFEDVRGQRYTEIFLIGGHAITHHLVGGVYNTIGLNDPTGTGDTSPQDVLDKVDIDALKEAYGDSSALDTLRKSCRKITSELSVYREDLSYVPK